MPFGDLGLKEGERVEFFGEVLEGQVELGRDPTDGPCTFVVPGRDFEAMMWSAQPERNRFDA